MPDHEQSTSQSPPRLPPNAFVRTFLARLAERDRGEPTSAAEADTAGPWQLMPTDRGYTAVIRTHTAPGDRPEAFFREYQTAALFAAILPGTGRDPLYFAAPEQTPWSCPGLVDTLSFVRIGVSDAQNPSPPTVLSSGNR